MKSKSLFIDVLVITATIAIPLICTRHQVIAIADSSHEVKNLYEFLQINFDGRVLEYKLLNNLMESGDGFTSEIRALQLKLVKSNRSNEVNVHNISILF